MWRAFPLPPKSARDHPPADTRDAMPYVCTPQARALIYNASLGTRPKRRGQSVPRRSAERRARHTSTRRRDGSNSERARVCMSRGEIAGRGSPHGIRSPSLSPSLSSDDNNNYYWIIMIFHIVARARRCTNAVSTCTPDVIITHDNRCCHRNRRRHRRRRHCTRSSYTTTGVFC